MSTSKPDDGTVGPLHSISQKYSSSIARMVGSLTTLACVVAVVLASFWLLNGADSRLQRMQAIAEVALPYPVWNLDRKAIDEFLRAMRQDAELRHVQLDMDGTLIALPRPLTGAPHEHFSPWLHEFSSFAVLHEGQTIAEVLMVQSRSGLWIGILTSVLIMGALNLLLPVLILQRSNYLTQHFIFQPLQRLEKAATRMADGNLEQQLDTSGDDEIASLARSLDRMRDAIHSLFDRLQEANSELTSQNQVLEEAVRERTLELEMLNARLNSENLRMGAELNISRQLQKMVLPRKEELSNIEGLELSTYMEPAHEVGGDYFDVLNEGGRVRIGIGDVTGHGLESGVLMLLTQSAVRTLHTCDEPNLSKMVETLNRSLVGNINRLGSGKNLTFALIDYCLHHEPEGVRGCLTVVGQHESLLICRNDGTVEEIDTLMLGMPIGLIDEIGEFLAEESVMLYPGDVAVLFTDGITEAANSEHELFGIERLKQVLMQTHEQNVEHIQQTIIEHVKTHMGAQELLDDLTLLIMKQKDLPTKQASRETSTQSSPSLSLVAGHAYSPCPSRSTIEV